MAESSFVGADVRRREEALIFAFFESEPPHVGSYKEWIS